MMFDAMKHILYQLDVVYKTSLPAGAKLLCANHPTTIDPVMMTTLVPVQVSILIHETLFKVPDLESPSRPPVISRYSPTTVVRPWRMALIP
jgi:1-acyl-sn-glycerol-3-phosphate acyltransferase